MRIIRYRSTSPRRPRRTGFALLWLPLFGLFSILSTGSAQAVVEAPPTAAQADPIFSFAVLPDTQRETNRAGDPRFLNRTSWLARNAGVLDLRFALHSGDLVDWDTPDHAQYQVAATAMKALQDGRIGYTIAPGNHDTAAVCPGGSACDPAQTRTLLRDTSTFNRYFSASSFGAVAEQFEPGKVDNVLSSYSAGDLQWGVLSLELWPRAAVVEWARRVVAARPRQNIIVVTHSYLNADGSIGTSAEYGSTSPQYLYDNLIKQYPNIKFVFSGHTGTSATREDIGVNGNRIYSFLQCLHDESTNPVRLVEIDTAANTVSTKIYAPYTNTSYPDYGRRLTNVSWVR
jgi:hypothetical protein